MEGSDDGKVAGAVDGIPLGAVGGPLGMAWVGNWLPEICGKGSVFRALAASPPKMSKFRPRPELAVCVRKPTEVGVCVGDSGLQAAAIMASATRTRPGLWAGCIEAS
jgi:hypothetical protein